ncbi:HET domain-containing protein [Apiospora hydei]|uniref:HET domain-containing protein n=1 Tax=Apiospora hydei TaxID=1337664 RepID=A0ABR1V6G5_9PEZI
MPICSDCQLLALWTFQGPDPGLSYYERPLDVRLSDFPEEKVAWRNRSWPHRRFLLSVFELHLQPAGCALCRWLSESLPRQTAKADFVDRMQARVAAKRMEATHLLPPPSDETQSDLWATLPQTIDYDLPVAIFTRPHCWNTYRAAPGILCLGAHSQLDMINNDFGDADRKKSIAVVAEGERILHSAIWSTKPVYFEDRAHTIVSWLRTCSTDKSDKHAECAAPAPPYPARFLDVNTSLDDRFIKLVRSGDVAPDPSTSRIRYLALSHCWGSTTTKPFTTAKATLRDRMSGIWISVLPKTFRDAIRVARVLEVQYLWIDSLCIVQDDLQDWTVEAAKMADVYQGSYFTIAATSSPDGDGGLYLDSVTPATRVDLRRAKESSKPSPNTSNAEPPDACYIRYPVASPDTIRSGPLSSRAWVLQEQMLSTRLVHFTDSQMFYQCAAGLSSEDGVLYNTATRSRGITKTGNGKSVPNGGCW